MADKVDRTGVQCDIWTLWTVWSSEKVGRFATSRRILHMMYSCIYIYIDKQCSDEAFNRTPPPGSTTTSNK